MTNLEINRNNTNLIKFIAILMVVLGHLDYLDCAGVWGVHLFLFVSGYGIVCSVEKNGLKDYWKKRINTVFLPYLFSTTIFLLIRILLGEQLLLKQIIASLCGLDFGLNLDATMWYISYIFALYLIVWVVYKLRNNSLLAIAMGVVMMVIITAAGFFGVVWHKGTIAWAYLFSFPLGVLIAKYRTLSVSKVHKLAAQLLILIPAIGISITEYGKMHGGVEELVFTFSASLAIFVICTMFTVPNIRNGFLRRLVGELPFWIYLNEGFILQHKQLFVGGGMQIIGFF